MNVALIYITLLVICWTVNPFIKKKILNTNKINVYEYYILNHACITIFVIGILYYLMYNGTCNVKCITNLDKKDYLYVLLGAITTLIGTFALMYIIKESEVSYTIPHIQPLIIILTLLGGFLYFNEKITLNKIIAIIFLITGLIFMNKK